jgi:hypothetical protein
LELDLHCLTTGATGTLIGQGLVTILDPVAPTASLIYCVDRQTETFDLTTGHTIDCQVTMTEDETSISCQSYIIEEIS